MTRRRGRFQLIQTPASSSPWWKFEYGIDMIDRSYYTAGHGDGDPTH